MSSNLVEMWISVFSPLRYHLKRRHVEEGPVEAWQLGEAAEEPIVEIWGLQTNQQ